MFDKVKMLVVKLHVCPAFRLLGFEGKPRSTEEQIDACFDTSIMNMGGNCIKSESELLSVEKECVISNLYFTLVFSLSLFNIKRVAIRVGFYFIHKAQHTAYYILENVAPIFLNDPIVKF